MSRTLEPLARRIRHLVARALVRLVDADKQMQTLQTEVLDQEVLDAVEHWEGYGLTAHPHPDAEGLLLCAGGQRARAIVVAVADRRYRLKGLQAGEVALYDDQGQVVRLGRTGITVEAARGVIINGNVHINGNLSITGSGGGAGTMTIQANVALTGNLTQTGNTTQTGNLASSGNLAGATLTMAGQTLTTAGAGAVVRVL